MRRRSVASVVLVTALAAACGDNARVPAGSEGSPTMTGSANVSPAPPRYDVAASLPSTGAGVMARSARPLEQAISTGGALAHADATQPDAPTAPSMVIRNGTANVQVDSLELGILGVQQLAAKIGGYVGNTTLVAGDNQVRSATLELRIPAARYDDVLSGIKSLGKVEAISSTAQDVGEEFVDITARAANAKRLEERLVSLLATRTGKLEDVLAVERELARVREEIERYDGRLRYLKSRVATSTLSITVHERLPLVSTAPGENVILDAFKDAWRNFVRFLAAVIASMGVLIPLAAIGVAGWIVRRRFTRAR